MAKPILARRSCLHHRLTPPTFIFRPTPFPQVESQMGQVWVTLAIYHGRTYMGLGTNCCTVVSCRAHNLLSKAAEMMFEHWSLPHCRCLAGCILHGAPVLWPNGSRMAIWLFQYVWSIVLNYAKKLSCAKGNLMYIYRFLFILCNSHMS